MFKKINYFFRFLILIILGHHFFWESTPIQAVPNEKLYELLALQRQLDIYSPLSENNLQGTHNSYNTDVYHTLFRYHDRQQRLSIGDQLKYGSRFLELDAHWTFSFWAMREDLLLCHGSSKYTFFPFHWGCSPFDKPLDEGLAEVSAWLEEPSNKNEVLIFYIEDHTEQHHVYLYDLLVKHGIAQAMIESDGCKKIPDTLTKAQILAQGKQLVFWKDEECSTFAPLAKLAFSDLGNLQRHAEDRTLIGTIDKRYVRGLNPRIEAHDVIESFKAGSNIINLDNFSINDERLYALLWSWDLLESDVDTIKMHNGCAQQKENARWQIAACEGKPLKAACFNREQNRWLLSEIEFWQNASSACLKNEGFVFSAPTNYLENQILNQLVKKNNEAVWLNIQKQDQTIVVGDTRQFN